MGAKEEPATQDATQGAAQTTTKVATQAEVRRSRIQLYVGFFAMLLVAALATNLYTTANLAKKGRDMVAPEGETLRIEAKGYAQGDPLWANAAMGDGEQTIGTDGGLLCCMASALSALGHETTPDALNAVLTQKGLYDQNGEVRFTRIGEAFPGAEGKAPATFKKDDVDAYLAAGRTPIVKVRDSGSEKERYVLIVGMEAGEYLAMDPASGETVPMSRFDRKAYKMMVIL